MLRLTLGCSTVFFGLLLVGCASAPTSELPATGDASAEATKAATPSAPKRSTVGSGGKYYQDDGPGDNPPANLDSIPDAIPREEPFLKGPNRPYVVFGVEYRPDVRDHDFKQRGIASWYGRKFHGQKTSSGELYDMYGMTAAHPTLPIPSYARVTSTANGKQVVVRVNDRGPFLHSRIMDLSYAAAHRLGIAQRGSGEVTVERITLAEIRQNKNRPTSPTGAGTAAPVAIAPTRPLMREPEPNTLREPDDVPLPTVANQQGVFIQLGAFSTADNAETFRAHVYRELDWLNEKISLVNGKATSGSPLIKLHLGPYPDRVSAQGVADKIRDQLNLKPVLLESK